MQYPLSFQSIVCAAERVLSGKVPSNDIERSLEVYRERGELETVRDAVCCLRTAGYETEAVDVTCCACGTLNIKLKPDEDACRSCGCHTFETIDHESEE